MDEDIVPTESTLLMPKPTPNSHQNGRRKNSKRSRLQNLASGRHTKTSTGTEEATMSIAAQESFRKLDISIHPDAEGLHDLKENVHTDETRSWLIINAFLIIKHFMRSLYNVTNPRFWTAIIIGCGTKTVSKVLQFWKKDKKLYSAASAHASGAAKIRPAQNTAIRTFIRDRAALGAITSIADIVAFLSVEHNLTVSKTVARMTLSKMGFTYQVARQRNSRRESDDVRKKREEFLKKMNLNHGAIGSPQYRLVVFTDESYVSKNYTTKRTWQVNKI